MGSAAVESSDGLVTESNCEETYCALFLSRVGITTSGPPMPLASNRAISASTFVIR